MVVCRYLFRMLRTLLSARGSKPDLITVYIDGSFAEVGDVCDLLRVKYRENQPISSKNARITQHYKATLSHMFETHPSADFGIVIEEDLDIAPDFFSYFSQTTSLLKEDRLIGNVHRLHLIEPPVNIFLRLMGSNYPGTILTLLS